LENDPYEMNNLAGREAVREMEEDLREKLDRWMVREGDYLPLPVHAMKGLKETYSGGRSKKGIPGSGAQGVEHRK
jgi:hypothetical protein